MFAIFAILSAVTQNTQRCTYTAPQSLQYRVVVFHRIIINYFFFKSILSCCRYLFLYRLIKSEPFLRLVRFVYILFVFIHCLCARAHTHSLNCCRRTVLKNKCITQSVRRLENLSVIYLFRLDKSSMLYFVQTTGLVFFFFFVPPTMQQNASHRGRTRLRKRSISFPFRAPLSFVLFSLIFPGDKSFFFFLERSRRLRVDARRVPTRNFGDRTAIRRAYIIKEPYRPLRTTQFI